MIQTGDQCSQTTDVHAYIYLSVDQGILELGEIMSPSAAFVSC